MTYKVSFILSVLIASSALLSIDCYLLNPNLRSRKLLKSSSVRCFAEEQTKQNQNSEISPTVARWNARVAQLKLEAAELEVEQRKVLSKSLASAFDTFDTNNDGVISLQELKDGLASRLKASVSEEQAQNILDYFDKSGDGVIQLDEFKGIEAFKSKLESIQIQEKEALIKAEQQQRLALNAKKQADAVLDLINNKPPTTPDKLLSVLPYLLPLLDALPYGGKFIIDLHLDQNPLFSFAGVLFYVYQQIPFSGLIAFFVFNLFSTNLQLNRIIRWNIQQAILLDIALIIPSFIGSFVTVLANINHIEIPADISGNLAAAVYLIFTISIVYCMVASALGIEVNNIPIISDQVRKRVPSTEEFRRLFDEQGNLKTPEMLDMERKKEEEMKKKNEDEK